MKTTYTSMKRLVFFAAALAVAACQDRKDPPAPVTFAYHRVDQKPVKIVKPIKSIQSTPRVSPSIGHASVLPMAAAKPSESVILETPPLPIKKPISLKSEPQKEILLGGQKNTPKPKPEPDTKAAPETPPIIEKKSPLLAATHDDPVKKGAAFIWPLGGVGQVVLPYGKTKGGLHNDGINIAAPNGTDIRAAAKGRVVYAGNEMQGFGNLILIRHDNGFTSFYGHCGTMTVKRGNHVKQGDIIGTVGSTGNVTKPQLHFELRKKTTLVNPSDYVSP